MKTPHLPDPVEARLPASMQAPKLTPAPRRGDALAAHARARASQWRPLWLGALGLLAVAALSAAIAIALEPAFAHHVQWRTPWAWALLAPVAAALLVRLWRFDRGAPSVRLPSLWAVQSAPRTLTQRLRWAPQLLRAGVLVAAVGALARPVDYTQADTAEEEGIDIVLVLDLSGSMKAIMDDGGPAPLRAGRRQNRLDVAKSVLADFVRRRKDDRIGVIVFGRAAYVLSPPTLDHSVLLTLISHMELDLIDPSGTAIGDALGTAVARLRRATGRSKVVVLVTDCDSNAGQVSPRTATELAGAENVAVHTVQIGTGDEVEIEQGTDLFGNPLYVRGAKIPVNPELLQEIADKTGGKAYIAADRRELESSMHQILDGLEKTQFQAARASARELFPTLLHIALGWLLLELSARLWLSRRLA